MSVKNICVLGAGTSGLISALILKQGHPNFDITIIKSSSIDIVGVGEGSTEHWATFMSYVGISPIELFKETGATFKYGIRFDNWNGDNKDYLHVVVSELNQSTEWGHPYLYHKLLVDSDNPLDCVGDFVLKNEHYRPYELSTNQYHFDTFKLNMFLQKKCVERGINIVEDTITEVSSSDTVIKKVKGSNAEYVADFFVDCSGFHRVLTKELGAEWEDCSDYLPVNSAITFPTKLDPTKELPSYTRATALSAGWCWQIPTQERFGNGYVYCDKFITEEQALAEVEELYGQKLEIVKRFKFSAGYLKTPWIGNVCAIGLSGSFVEPLEATNIGTAIQQAFGLNSYIASWDNDSKISDIYNKQFVDVFQNIIDFIQLHYITKRDDSKFWKYCRNLKLTNFNNSTLDIFKKNMPVSTIFTKPYILFRNVNWFLVMYGLDMIDRYALIEKWSSLSRAVQLEAAVKLFVIKNNNSSEISVGHRDAIKNIIERDT